MALDSNFGPKWSPKALGVFCLIEGTILLVLGCLAVIVPSISSSTVTLIIGWLFLISGVVGFVPVFLAKSYPGYWWSLISAILAILVGVMLVGNDSQDLYGGLIGWPLEVASPVPVRRLLVIFFLIEGAASIMFGFEHRRQFTPRWAWIVLSGVIDLMLGTVIIFDLPGTSAWTMGLFIGINMIAGGIALMGMGRGLTQAVRAK